jgi:NAD(P)-dependent dehydrogenase (short-subunit alcohol dehydrogenase family)
VRENKMSTLQNKTALVTGASRGIGRATAFALAQAGARILVHYGGSAQDAESLVAAIHSHGGRANAIRADLGTPEGATLLAKEVRFGDGSNINFVSSIAAHAVVGKPGVDSPSILAYASTKGSIRDFGQELGCHSWAARHLGMQALKRIGKPEDVADVVAFLASEAARWITGASIPVDGGSKL